MKAVSLKFGQGNLDSTTTGTTSEDELLALTGPANKLAPAPPPLPNIRSPDFSPPKSPAPQNNGDSPILGSGSNAEVLADLLQLASQHGFSDLQLQTERLIYATSGGSTRPYDQWGKLSGSALAEILELLYSHRTVYQGFEQAEETNKDLWQRLATERKIDFACEGGDPGSPVGAARLRVQGHLSQQGVGISIRVLGNEIPLLDKLGLPAEVVESLRQKVTKQQGLGLVVGPTGSGKTTTLAAIIDWVRRQHHKHIVTVEDPIEYRYVDTIEVPGGVRPSPTLVTQQEVGAHVHSFEQGLVDALRKKPDIILVGEIRTAETLRIALEAAETGHFILSTVHTRGAGKTLGRMRQMFSLEQARGILQQFADVGSFILSQGLMPDLTGRYVLCCEYFSIQEIEDRNAIRKYAEGGFQDVEERLNKPYNRKWNAELKALLNTKRITPEVYTQFYQVTGLENKL